VSWTAQTINVAGSNVANDAYAPKKMTLSSPALGASGITAMPTLTWVANPEATRYVIQINHTGDFAAIDPGAQSFTNSYNVQTLLNGSDNYQWRIDAYDVNNHAVGGTEQIFNFTVIAPIFVTVNARSGGLNNPNCCAPGSNNSGDAATLGAILGNGEKVWISATGSINWFPDPATAGPGGVGLGPADTQSLAPGVEAIALIGSINGAPWQLIGNGPTMMQAVGGGVQLLLAVNDSYFDDNFGSWTVKIQK
jgi:hypothetical protein